MLLSLKNLPQLRLIVGLADIVTTVSAQSNIVDLGYAKYQGLYNSTSDITSFLGIRYAAPPTGSLRWQPPQSPDALSGVQQADAQPNACFQSTFGTAESNPFSQGELLRKRDVIQTEDCLFLNVFVPGNVRPNASMPVLVWIHGGGYALGSSGGDGGDFIRDADGGVISVVIQYRLGVFGFLPGAAVKANGALNAGLLDQEFALQWVQDHITSFGGDPAKVTIWGESAGAGSVLQHIVAHGGKATPPLFRAAMTSSTFLPPQYNYDVQVSEKIYGAVTDLSNCTTSQDSLSCLRALDAGLLEIINTNVSSSGFSGTFVFVPVVDGEFIVERPLETIRKGYFNGDALLSMTNTFEGRIFVTPPTASNISTYVANLFPNFCPEQISATVAQYTGVAGLETTFDQAIAIMGESIFICPTYHLLEAFGDKGFKGEFAIPPGNHGDDIRQYFPSSPDSAQEAVTANRTFLASFSQSFLAVVKSLDPNMKFDAADITPLWSPWNSSGTEMLFNVTATDQAVIHPINTDPSLLSRCSFWQSLSSITPQ